VVEALLARGAGVNARNSTGATPLHDAALAGNADLARLLIEKGAQVDARDGESGATPLHHAASWGRAAVVRLLLEKGADPTLRNKSGKTPLDLAREAPVDEVIEALTAAARK
jgi:ankyrin repeat protein